VKSPNYPSGETRTPPAARLRCRRRSPLHRAIDDDTRWVGSGGQ
jgi:hypothetical protein